MRRAVFPACDAISIPRVSFLALRRTFSILAQKHGIPATTIASIRVTLI
jgi:hypothetical protein